MAACRRQRLFSTGLNVVDIVVENMAKKAQAEGEGYRRCDNARDQVNGERRTPRSLGKACLGNGAGTCAERDKTTTMGASMCTWERSHLDHISARRGGLDHAKLHLACS